MKTAQQIFEDSIGKQMVETGQEQIIQELVRMAFFSGMITMYKVNNSLHSVHSRDIAESQMRKLAKEIAEINNQYLANHPPKE